MSAFRLIVVLAAGAWGVSPSWARDPSKLDDALFVPCDVYRPQPANQATPADASQADQWLERAKVAITERRVAEALRCAAAALAYRPEDATARRLLGYRRVEEAWGGGYAARMHAAGRVWHSEHGWVTSEQRAQMDQGLRPFGQGWISIEEDERRHAKIENGWTVRTDNFQVVTNASRGAAANLAIELESLYVIWLQRFGDFAIEPRELQARWDGREAIGYRKQPFRVVHHRSREQYNDALRRHQPQIDKTLGIYFDFLRQTHFFAGEEQDPGTIRHEAVHQFFQESGKTTRRAAATANAWALEGVACYFESLEKLTIAPDAIAGQAYRLGAPEAGRLPAARQRRLKDGFYVKWADVAPLNMLEFQSRPDLPPLYSQIAGWATFCCEYKQGKYRAAFGDLLRRIYTGRDEPGTLEELTQVGYNELDRQYADYLENQEK